MDGRSVKEVCDLIFNQHLLEDESHLQEVRNIFLGNIAKLEDSEINFERKVMSCQSDLTRIQVVQEFFRWIPIPPHFFQKLEKSSELSIEFRERANGAYKQLNLKGALNGFNLAICFGRAGEEETGLSYANRSLIFLHLQEPQLALKDIHQAEKNNFPARLRDKLIERRKKCEAMLKEQAEEKEVDLIQTKKDDDEKSRMLNKSKDKGNSVHGPATPKSSDTDEERKREKRAFHIREHCHKEFFRLKQPSECLIGAEDFVRIDVTPQRGRRIIVDKDIPAGSVIMVENPYVIILEKELHWDLEHCAFCLTRLLAGIPCDHCTLAMYCNEECREQARNSHQYEHKSWAYLHSIQRSRRDLLALRIIGRLGPKKVYDLYKEASSCQQEEEGNGTGGGGGGGGHDENQNSTSSGMTKCRGLNKEGRYDPSSYTVIYNLVSHPETENFFEVVSNTFKALVLTHLLASYSPFFDHLHLLLLESGVENTAKVKSELFDFTASLLLHHLENIPFNAISLSEFRTSSPGQSCKTRIKTLKGLLMAETPSTPSSTSSSSSSADCPQEMISVSYASGIFGLLAMCNHSCNPNSVLLTSKVKQRTAVVSLRRISAGSEVCITYGPIFSIQSQLEARRSLLQSKYSFTCDCEACANNWQVETTFDRKQLELSGQLVKNGTTLKELDSFELSLRRVYELLERGEHQEAMEGVKPCLKYFVTKFPPYFPLTLVAQDLFKKALVHIVNT